VVELPNASCDGAAHSAKQAKMAAARKAFVTTCGGLPPTSHFRLLTGTATVTGIGFFDKPHNASRQGSELPRASPAAQLHCVVLVEA
jgi:hypothetical protein